MVMRYGRRDCGDSPREQAEDFPNPRMGLDGVLSWCSRVFDFSDRECVAILGKMFRLDTALNSKVSCCCYVAEQKF